MKFKEWNEIAELVGMAAVFVGILLLVYELHQNGEVMRAQTRNEISQGAVNLLTLAVNDGSFQSVIRRGRFGEGLSEIEQFQFQRYYNAWFRYWENMHYQYRIGLYDETEFAKQREAIKSTFSTSPGIVKYWCARSSLYSLEFAAEIEALQTTYKCE